MAEQAVDFGNFNKIQVNPIIPLQMLNIYCRTNSGVQATIMGKVYSSCIEILEIVPVGLCNSGKVENIDFIEHQRNLENITTVYPTLQILGVAVTDLQPNINLAILHTMYSDKQSGFKTQGILNSPIILSIGTTITKNSTNLPISAYMYNHTYTFCKQLMEVTAFQKLPITISLGESDIFSMTPLFEAYNDQEKMIPETSSGKQMIKKLAQNLKQLKLKCDGQKYEEIRVKLRRIIDRLNTEHQFDMQELSFLLDQASLQVDLSVKINKFHKLQ